MDTKIKRIGIDARFYGSVGKGLGRYTQEMVDNIIKLDPKNEYVVFLSQANFDEFVCDGERVKKVLADVRWYTLKEQILMPLLLKRAKLDLVHFPHFNVPFFYWGKFVVTIHDLILIKYPTIRATTLSHGLYWLKNMAYRVVIWSAVHRSQKIITVSEFTKQDILKHWHIKTNKVVVTYEGVANLSKGRESLFDLGDDRSALLRYNINKPFLLYVGNVYPHKNLERLLEVFAKIYKQQDKNLQLVLVGKEDYFYEKLKGIAANLNLWQPNDKSPVIFSGYVTDAQLEVLFKQALVYVFPSLYEGFGLPPLEAMAKGCPVVSSDRSCLPEILGEAAIYFNPENNADMIEKIIMVIGDEATRTEMKRRGFEQVKKYSWWECARATYEVYKEVIYGRNEA